MDSLFLALDAGAQSQLLLWIPQGEHRLYLLLLAPDDAADLIRESPKREHRYLLDLLDDETKQEVKALLASLLAFPFAKISLAT